MSKTVFQGNHIQVASYCGPANTLERTRMRLQIDLIGADIASLGYNEVRELSIALDRWLVENDRAPREEPMCGSCGRNVSDSPAGGCKTPKEHG